MSRHFENLTGDTIDLDAAAHTMDDDIREAVHDDMAPCSAQAFADEYARRHRETFGADWPPYVGGAW